MGARFLRRFKAVRVTLLLLVLAWVMVWGARVELARWSRRQWQRTVVVDVILLQDGVVSPESLSALREALPRLERLLTFELHRYRPASPPPFRFRLHGPVRVSLPPPEPPEPGELLNRVFHYLDLIAYLRRVEKKGSLRLRGGEVQLYVTVEPVKSRDRFAEGFGAVGGELGMVRTAIDQITVDQAMLAMMHELLHCLGAQDKYDDEGHAIEPTGLAEPELEPRYPQRYAEPMVGEVPLSRGRGDLIRSLSEVRVNYMTAREIGWLK